MIGVGLLGCLAARAGAQTLLLKREPPLVEWAGCPALPPPESTDDARRQQAESLAASATEASILGDNAAALDRLTRAATLDPASPAITYRLARTLEVLDRDDDAVAEYCRYLSLPGAADSAEVRDRLAELTQPDGIAVSAAAAQAYDTGIAHFDAGSLVQAEAAFQQALDAAPMWSAPVFNRALVLIALGRRDEAARDLRQYLEMSPGAPDFDQVLDLLSSLRGVSPYNPVAALATGLVVPGLGHFTTGRPVTGAVFLGSAAGALAVGLLTQRTEVECLATPVDGRCPPDQVLRENVERPYLTAALAVAAAIGIGGAIDAYRGARSRNAAAPEVLRFGEQNGAGGAALVLPRVHLGPDGPRLYLLRLRF